MCKRLDQQLHFNITNNSEQRILCLSLCFFKKSLFGHFLFQEFSLLVLPLLLSRCVGHTAPSRWVFDTEACQGDRTHQEGNTKTKKHNHGVVSPASPRTKVLGSEGSHNPKTKCLEACVSIFLATCGLHIAIGKASMKKTYSRASKSMTQPTNSNTTNNRMTRLYLQGGVKTQKTKLGTVWEPKQWNRDYGAQDTHQLE